MPETVTVNITQDPATVVVNVGDGGGGGDTDISITRTATTVTVASSNGADGIIAAADASNAGILTAANHIKLAALSGTNTGDQDLSTLAVKSANLSDLASAATARTNLGLGSAAVLGTSTGGNSTADAGKAAAYDGDGVVGTSSKIRIWEDVGQGYYTDLLGVGDGAANSVQFPSGGPVVMAGGAGGTPSSITLTNGTGLPIGTGVSGLGTGVAAALAVNTGSAGAMVLQGGSAALTTITASGAVTVSANGAASAPAVNITGVPFAGTGTTSFPLVYINETGATASTVLNTAGTLLGVNGNGTSDLMNLLTDGVSMFKVSSTGALVVGRDITATRSVSAGSAYGFTWPGKSIIICPSNGTLLLQNTAATAGVRLDFITSSTLKVLNFAGSGDGNLTAAAGTFSTTLAVTGATTLTGAVTTASYIAGVEMTAPAAPAENGFRIFAEDNGAGKTRLMVQFATGAAQQLAIEP